MLFAALLSRVLAPYPAIAGAVLLCGVASQAYGHGGYDEEIKRTDEQIAVNPEDGKLWLHRGHLNFLHGDWQQSLVDLEKADRLVPGQLFTDYVRGQALTLGGHLDWGKAVLDKFITEHGDYADAYAARARIWMKMSRGAEAAKDFALAIQKSKNPEPDLYKDTADAWISAGEIDSAVSVLELGMARLGVIPQLAIVALDLEISNHRFDAALRRIDAMRKNAPRPEPWMARRAEVLAQTGRAYEARAAWIALRDRIAALPNIERGSNAMSQITIQAQEALRAMPVAQNSGDR